MKRPVIFVSALVATLSAITCPAAAKPPSPPAGSAGTGQVFFPNPVASTGNQSLTDQKDADYPALSSAYRVVTLTNLDGSGYLRGDWANVVSSTGPLAYSPTNTFIYRRNDDRFEQVMAYYWVTEAQKYIQSLGFGSRLPAINRESQDIRINQYGADNAFYREKKDLMRFGKGGVDDAEDADVILHEYGHAIQDAQVSGFGSSLKRARSVRASATTGPPPSPRQSPRARTQHASATGTPRRTPRRFRTVCDGSTPPPLSR